jgi:hypothetical protein
MRLKNKKSQNKEKWKKDVLQLNFKKFLYCYFLAGPLALHLEDDL